MVKLLGKASLALLVYRQGGWAALREYRKVLRGGDASYAVMLRSDPGLAFDADYYWKNSRTVRNWHINPWHHYVLIGSVTRRHPHPLFDREYYLTENKDVRDSGIDPFFHYISHGMRERRAPSAQFDPQWYLMSYKDVAASKIDPFLHYLEHGQREGRLTREQGSMMPPYDAWRLMNRLSLRDQAELRAALDERSEVAPKISLITPIYNTDPALFDELVEAVLGQISDDWEWCLVDDASPSAHVAPMLARAAALDGRIKVSRLEENGGISVATNAGVAMATGDIVAFLDHDDLVTPDCVAELAIYYADHPDADIVYSDDDKVEMSGEHYAPQFKPDWAPVLLLSFMYLGHVFSVRRELFTALGGFRKAFDGSQDYDFALRAAELARHIGHIPKILYHWRAAPGSTAQSADTKPASLEAGRLAVQEAAARRGYAFEVVIQPDWAVAARCGVFDIRFVDDGPSVTLILPTRNQVRYLETCITSLEATTYRNYDILVIDNESDDPATLEYLEAISERPNVRVVRIENREGRFSFSAVNNAAVRLCTSEYILFLNNDTKVIAPGWLSQMMGYARMPGVGAVGARLYFEDDTIQHAGIVHGYNEGLVGHAFRNYGRDNPGYMGFIRAAREYSGVTAACMLTPRHAFEQVGGFDEANFAVAYNDVDYCYRLIDAGWTCVYCPSAELYHFEGKSRGFKDNPRERANLRRLYRDWQDRWYNPNLTLENERFEPAAIRGGTRSRAPLRLAVVSHNLNHEGAPTTLMDLTIGLARRGIVAPHVVSPEDGPLRAHYEAAGIPVTILDYVPMHGIPTDETYDEQWIEDGNLAFGRQLKAMGVEIVMANTLITYWAITGAAAVGIPAIWCQHESEPWEHYYDYLPPEIRPTAYGAFALAYRVLYVAEATRSSWRALDSRRNFQVIRHGIPLDRLATETGRWNRRDARARLGVGDDEIMVEIVGTVCRRKGQIDLIRAFAALPAEVQRRLRVFLVGHVADQDYGDEVSAAVAELSAGIADRMIVTGSVEDPFLYYTAADIAVCTSRIESAPRVIVEAMACGVPIITTPVFGIPELVNEDVNALFYEPGDVAGLAAKLALLVGDDRLRARLASHSRAVLDGQPGFDEMVTGYARVLRSAVNLRVDPDAVDDGRQIVEVEVRGPVDGSGGAEPVEA